MYVGEKYIGTKFKTHFRNTFCPYSNMLNELRFWCETFSKNELAPLHETGSSGNLSFRNSENSSEFYITASSSDLAKLSIETSFVLVHSCDFKVFQLDASGCSEPSSESILHATLYAVRPDINAIFHGHSSEILRNAISLNIPVTEQEYDYGTRELVNAAVSLANNDFFILKNHGFISLGNTMQNAGDIILKILSDCRK